MVVVDSVERRSQIRVQRPRALGHRAFAHLVDRLDRVVAASARPEPVRSGLEPGLPLGFQRAADPVLVTAVHDHWDGDFILPLLQSRAGLDLVSCDRRWLRGRADVVTMPAGTDIPGLLSAADGAWSCGPPG